jgi:cytochrome d ubiquinol oxidase subunit II
VLAASLVALVATDSLRPEVWTNYREHLWGYLFPLAGAAGLAGMRFFTARGNDRAAFLSSALFIAGMLASTAFGLFPNVLPASTSPEFGLTVYNASAQPYGLAVGITWWSAGIILAIGYFTYLFFQFRGKIKVPAEGEGY